jgi:hypothetical protein
MPVHAVQQAAEHGGRAEEADLDPAKVAEDGEEVPDQEPRRAYDPAGGGAADLPLSDGGLVQRRGRQVEAHAGAHAEEPGAVVGELVAEGDLHQARARDQHHDADRAGEDGDGGDRPSHGEPERGVAT